jgi:hypothetical protein
LKSKFKSAPNEIDRKPTPMLALQLAMAHLTGQQWSQVFFDHKKLVAGDVFMIEWIPGAGTVITIKGQPQGEPFKEPEFYNAMMRIWLGPNPADWKLKDALLGKAA